MCAADYPKISAASQGVDARKITAPLLHCHAGCEWEGLDSFSWHCGGGGEHAAG